MGKALKRIVMFVMMLSLLTAMMAVPVGAANQSAAKKYNIMFVMDGSGSLISNRATDPDGLRFDLMIQVLEQLSSEGHYLGAIVFSGPLPQERDASAVANSVFVNTGMLSVDEDAPDGTPVKDYIRNQMKKDVAGRADNGVDERYDAGTDIGTALLAAQEALAAAHDENGLDGKIVLFTDGITDINHAAPRELSIQNRIAATNAMKENGVGLFGVFLNSSAHSDEEMKTIVSAANGIPKDAVESSGLYAEISSIQTANLAVAPIMKFLGKDVNPMPILDELDADFTVPKIGIEEIDIDMYTVDGSRIPDLIVELTENGSPFNSAGISRGTTFVNYNLYHPVPGMWHLHIEKPKGSNVGYQFSPVADLSVGAVLEMNRDAADITANMTVGFTGYLTKDGKTITDPAMYDGYDAFLQFTNRATGEVKEFPIPRDSNGQYKLDLLLDFYGDYSVKAVFKCGMVINNSGVIYMGAAESASQVLHLDNEAPVAQSPVELTVKYGFLQPSSAEFDLSEYASDREDGKNLKAIVESATLSGDTYRVNGMLLTIVDSKSVGSGEINFKIADSCNAAADMQVIITSKNMTLPTILTILLVIVAVVVVVLLVMRFWFKAKPDGELRVSFTLEDLDDSYIRLTLPVPGNSWENNTTLQRLVAHVLKEEEWYIPGTEVDAGTVSAALQTVKNGGSIYDAMGKVKVAKKIKLSGLKRHVVLAVKNGDESEITLDDSQAVLTLNHVRVTLSYTKSIGSSRSIDYDFDEDDDDPGIFYAD